jgi:hypothetical protein
MVTHTMKERKGRWGSGLAIEKVDGKTSWHLAQLSWRRGVGSIFRTVMELKGLTIPTALAELLSWKLL